MNQIDRLLYGAWKIEDSPDGSELGPPNTHWLIGATRITVCTASTRALPGFTLRYDVSEGSPRNKIQVIDEYQSVRNGYYEIEGNVLFIVFGNNWQLPPRIEPQSGFQFAFTRDEEVEVPVEIAGSREPFDDDIFGRIQRDDVGDWVGHFQIAGWRCKLSMYDGLVAVDTMLSIARTVRSWLNSSVERVVDAAAAAVFDFICDDGQLGNEYESAEAVKQTMSVTELRLEGRRALLYVDTSIRIDHVVVVELEVRSEQVELRSAYIAG